MAQGVDTILTPVASFKLSNNTSSTNWQHSGREQLNLPLRHCDWGFVLNSSHGLQEINLTIYIYQLFTPIIQRSNHDQTQRSSPAVHKDHQRSQDIPGVKEFTTISTAASMSVISSFSSYCLVEAQIHIYYNIYIYITVFNSISQWVSSKSPINIIFHHVGSTWSWHRIFFRTSSWVNFGHFWMGIPGMDWLRLYHLDWFTFS